MGNDTSAAWERVDVLVTNPLSKDTGACATDIKVERWDEQATAWAWNKARERYGNRHPEPVRDLFVALGIVPDLITIEKNCNMVVLGGWAALLGGVGGTSITNKFSATQGRIGFGTSSAAVAATQTFLQGDTGSSSTTSYYALCGAGPTISTASAPATMVFTASFGGSVANFAWNEFATDNWNVAGVTAQSLGVNEVFFNRGVSSQGTKASGQTWAVTETLSFGFPSGSGTVS